MLAAYGTFTNNWKNIYNINNALYKNTNKEEYEKMQEKWVGETKINYIAIHMH